MDAHRWGSAMAISNFFFQVISLIKPLSDVQVTVNICYMLGTLISICVLIYASKNQKMMKQITYGVCVYTIFRNSFRLFDFEETRDKYESKDRWYFLVFIQGQVSALTLVQIFSCFEIGIYKNIAAIFLTVWIYGTTLAGIYDDIGEAFKQNISFLFFTLFIYNYQMGLVRGINQILIQQIQGR